MAFEYQNFASLGVNLNRQKYGPLDISNVFNSEADLKYYLTKGTFTEGVSDYWIGTVPYPYEGQVIATVIDGVVNVFVLALNENNEFITQEISGKIEVDGDTIEIAADGSIKLVGVDGLATTKDDGEGNQVTITYQPRYKNGKLTWEELSSTTIEDVSLDINGLKSDVQDINGRIEDLNDKIDNITIPEVPTNVSAFNNDAGYQNASEVEALITNKIADINHAVFEKVESKPEVEEAKDNILYLVPVDDKYEIYAKISNEMVLIDDTDVDLTGYVKEDVLEDYVTDIELADILGSYAAKSDYVSNTALNDILSEYATQDNIKDFVNETAVFDILNSNNYITKNSLDTVLLDYLKTEDSLTSEDVENIIGEAFVNKNALDLITKEKIEAWDKEDFISSISSEFIVDDNKELSVYEIAQSKVSGLINRLEEIEKNLTPGAQENTIESISINGVILNISNKVVDLPIANSTTLGVVKSSSKDNQISVQNDGTMSVNKINVDNLIQTEGSCLILDGGSASSNITEN